MNAAWGFRLRQLLTRALLLLGLLVWDWSGLFYPANFAADFFSHQTAQAAGLSQPDPPIAVRTTADGGPGSLRWAIQQANRQPGPDQIDLSQVRGTIRLQSSLPPITDDLRLVGNGDDVISGGHQQRVLTVARGQVTLANLTIADGRAEQGGGLLISSGSVRLEQLHLIDNWAIGQGETTAPAEPLDRQTDRGANHGATQGANHWATDVQTRIQADKNNLDVNRGGIVGVNGISLPNLDGLDLEPDGIRIDGSQGKYRANRGAVAGVSGIGIGGIGSLTFAGGGGIGGIGNAGNGGQGGQGGESGGDGGNGGNGGDGGTGLFRSFNVWDNQGGIGAAVFSGGSGFGGIGNAGNGGQGGDAKAPTASGGDGGNGGDGGDGRFGEGRQAPAQSARMRLAGMGRAMVQGTAQETAQETAGAASSGRGGAIYIQAGELELSDTTFRGNRAVGQGPAGGKGGALFVGDGAKVMVLGALPSFQGNLASQAADLPLDNPDFYGAIELR